MPDRAIHDTTDALTVSLLQVRFGDAVAISDVSMRIREGSFTGIIGPNGAGKTTLLNAISGLVRVAHGTVVFEGVDITNARPHRIARSGVARTFQGVQLVPQLTCLENVLIGQHAAMRGTIVAAGLGIGRSRGSERKAKGIAMDALTLVGASDLAHLRADQLPYGPQKLVELARAVTLQPRLLLLDEPTSGMTVTEKTAVVESVERIRAATKTTVAIIEHDVGLVRRVCDELVVMEAGAVIATGVPSSVLSDPRVQKAYLGVGRANRANALANQATELSE